MNFGDWPRGVIGKTTAVWTAAAMALLPGSALAQDDMAAPAEGAEGALEAAAEAPGYTPLGPDMIVGQPVDGGWNVQPQYSDIGQYAMGLHTGLIWVMIAICVFVLGLLLWVILRYNKRANPTPSKTTHNTLIEVIWTVVPVLILVGIAVPSISLISKQYQSPPENAVTIKATGYQWYWGYTYPDYGGFEVISNMMPEDEAREKGFPGQLEVDNRMVVPVGVPLRIQTTAADVIHSFAVPALWYKLDAIPGRLNERMLTITRPGIYYGQCSELCGERHGYMPIAVEAVPMEQFEAWVLTQGGSLGEDAAEAPREDAPETPVNEAAADGTDNDAEAADAAAAQ